MGPRNACVVVAYGLRGDVEPLVGDSRCSRGHSARRCGLCAPPDFAELLARVGVPYLPPLAAELVPAQFDTVAAAAGGM
jgi:hypothetical protein